MATSFGNIVLNQCTITLTGLKTLNNSKPRTLTPEGKVWYILLLMFLPLDWPGQATRESYTVTGNMDQKRNNCPVSISLHRSAKILSILLWAITLSCCSSRILLKSVQNGQVS